MKIRIIIILTIMPYLFGIAQCETKLTFKGDTAFDPTNSELYNGEYKEFFPGNIKVKGTYIDGLKSGKFYYFNKDNFPEYDSIVEYSNGKKEGRLIRYSWANYQIADENYSMDKKNGTCYYWHETGQLMRITTYLLDSIIYDEKFHVDSSILQITYILPFEKFDQKEDFKFIMQKDYLLLDSVKIQIVIYKYIKGDDTTQWVLDTIMNNDFKVTEFRFEGTVYDNDSTTSHFHCEYISNSNYFSKEMLRAIRAKYTPRFWISELYIVDNNNIRYPLPYRGYRVFYK